MGIVDGKVAVITGSGRGIGKAIATLFLEEGAKVTINDIDADVCNATAKELNEAFPDSAIACVADVTNKEQVEKMMADTVTKFGKIDILVNNAGLTRDALIHKLSDKMMDLIFDINFKGTMVCTRAVIPYFIKKERNDEFKKIVNFTSAAGGITGNFGQINYGMAKGANIAFSKACARELSGDRVSVNVVGPGFVETRMTAEKVPGVEGGMPKALRAIAIAGIPFSRDGRAGLPIDLAKAVMFYSSYLSDWITAQVTAIDGAGMI